MSDDRALIEALRKTAHPPPETERVSHYFHARLPQQFDVVLHFDETRAVEPLERVAPPVEEELPETYPAGV